MRDSPKVSTWWLEQDSNLLLSRRKVPNLPLKHHVPRGGSNKYAAPQHDYFYLPHANIEHALEYEECTIITHNKYRSISNEKNRENNSKKVTS